MSESPRYKAVVYDCDGVMFDSLEANCIFYESIFTAMGTIFDRNDKNMMRIIHTYANRDVLRYFYPETEEWNRALYVARSLDYLRLIPLMKIEAGLRETLERLKGMVHLAVCTNRSSSMEAVLDEFKLTDYFSLIMTAARASFPKPHPDPLLRILAHYGLNPEEVLFVGDSEVDSQAAMAAGVPFAGYKADLDGIARIDHHEEILALIYS